MCGAFEQHTKAMLGWVDLLGDWPCDVSRINIRPTMMAGTLDAEGYRERKWSLIPAWAKEPKLSFSTFNARAETLSEKPAFRQAWRRSQRCIVAASAYFEWPTLDGKKQCHRLFKADGSPWLMAGLWEFWHQGSEHCDSFTVITATPAPEIEWAHHRMPLMIDRQDMDCWLTGSPEEAARLLTRITPDEIVCKPGDPKDAPED